MTPEERAIIQQKMAKLGTRNFSAYARKMLIDGYLIHMDTSDIRAQGQPAAPSIVCQKPAAAGLSAA